MRSGSYLRHRRLGRYTGSSVVYANESGTITVTLMGTSSSLPYVRSLALKRKEVSVMIVDANDSASVNVAEERCRVIKPPDITRAKEIGSESVSIFVPSLNYR